MVIKEERDLALRRQLSPVYTFYLHKHVIFLRIEAPNQPNALGPALGK